MNQELPHVQAGFRKGRGTRETKWQTSIGSQIKEENSRRTYTSVSIDYTKTFDCVDHKKLWEILKEMGIQDTLPASWEPSMRVKKQELEQDMEK